MTTRSNSLLLAGIVIFLSITGCSAMDDRDNSSTRVFDQQQTKQQADELLATWFPVGTPVSEAVAALEKNGFSCSPVQVEAGSLRGMSCDLSIPEPAGPQAARLALSGWSVMLIEDEKHAVARILVGRFPEDLGSNQ